MLGSVPARRQHKSECSLVSALRFQPLWEAVTPKASVGPVGHNVFRYSIEKAAQMRWLVSCAPEEEQTFAGV